VLLRGLALVLVAAALSACGGGSKQTTTTSDLAPGCEVAVAGRAITGYLAAVTSGSRTQIRAHLSPQSDFARLTVDDSDGRTFTTTSRAKAVDWLVGRHAFSEHERLLNVQVAPGTDENHDSITGTISRSAADFATRGITNRLADFAGSVACLSGTISQLQIRSG